MKKIFTVLLLIAMTIQFGIAQDNCNPYYILKKGSKWTHSNYNAKDKYEGKQSFEVLDVQQSGNKLVATVKVMTFDKKDKLDLEKEVEFICEDGIVQMDMSQYVPAEMVDSFKDMDVKMEVDQVAFPESLNVGQSLPDGGVKITMNGPMAMSFEVKVVDRKVMAQEELKVPAGSFDTYKINSITEINMMGKREMKNVEWIAKEVGLVRAESYDKNGKLKFYSVLTEYQK